jgi:hypothetical protein
VYSVESDLSVQQQIDALPAEALATLAEVRVVLETDPGAGVHGGGEISTPRSVLIPSAEPEWSCT